MVGGGPPGEPVVECVVNISEGRDVAVVDAIARAGGDVVLDVHSDSEHHRTVLTLGGPLTEVESAARAVATEAVGRIDLSVHDGVHPRLGAVDVVPFVALDGPDGGTPADAARPADLETVVAARDRFAEWAGSVLGVPCFLYGPERTLPEVRRNAYRTVLPDTGPPRPHPTAGSMAVGARRVLVAYNVWIAGDGPAGPPAGDVARELATALRRPGLRTLGLTVAAGAQVSCNLVDPVRVPLDEVYDAVSRGAVALGCRVVRGELVGLLPATVLDSVPPDRWAELGLRPEDTIESHLASGGSGGP